MLERTFVHIPGIGKATEQTLWGHGETRRGAESPPQASLPQHGTSSGAGAGGPARGQP